MTHKTVAYAILDFLQSSIDEKVVKAEDAESIGVAMQCIGEAFGVELGNDQDKAAHSIRPATLKSLVDVFAAAAQKKRDGQQAQTAAAAATPATASASDVQQADAFKAEGTPGELVPMTRFMTSNAKLAAGKFADAIEAYTNAIKLNPNNAVYFANRAAANSQLGDQQQAINDCQNAIAIDPAYNKAYSRLGLAYYSLGQYEEAVQAYKDGLKLDPSNVAMKQSLERAEQHISGAVKSAATPAAAPTGAAANPFAGLGGGAGGMPDIGALLNNPALMGMAQSMMQNPQMASMYNEMQGLMGAGGGGGVGMPDLSSLMSNPQVQQMAARFAEDPSALNGLLGAMGGGGNGSAQGDGTTQGPK